ncbi:hypothetical protein BDZ85DRAFT_252575 [Elsinoe ampelina]|uniref:Uncharacterized protein n=1 Tax=Elsinoe ampelina TaxID=302913 RepID=A0A6A6G2B1_9PEZI|nr:hypothetical protein BDZ85DRAFT_252575 [Elsinoe ampelina]
MEPVIKQASTDGTMKVPHQPHGHSHHNPFMLPAELRRMIWQHLYRTEARISLYYSRARLTRDEPNKDRNLLASALQYEALKDEILYALYKSIRLVFITERAFSSFSRRVTATHKDLISSFLVKQDMWPQSFYPYRKWQRIGEAAGTFRGLKELDLAITHTISLQHGVNLAVMRHLVEYMDEVYKKCETQRVKEGFEGNVQMRVTVPTPPAEKTFAWKRSIVWEIRAYGREARLCQEAICCLKVLWPTRSNGRPDDRYVWRWSKLATMLKCELFTPASLGFTNTIAQFLVVITAIYYQLRYDDDDRPAKKARIGDKVNLLDLPDEMLQKICMYFYKTQCFHLVVPGDRFEAAIAPPLDRERLGLVITCRRLKNMALWALYAHSCFIFGGTRALMALAIRQPEIKYLVRRAVIQQMFDPYGESTTRTNYMFAGQLLRHFTQLKRVYLMICRPPDLALAPDEGGSYFIENRLTEYFTRGLRLPTKRHGVSQMKVTVVVQANERRDDPENEEELVIGQKDLKDGKIVLGWNCTAGIRYYQLSEATEAVSFACKLKLLILNHITMRYIDDWICRLPGRILWWILANKE